MQNSSDCAKVVLLPSMHTLEVISIFATMITSTIAKNEPTVCVCESICETVRPPQLTKRRLCGRAVKNANTQYTGEPAIAVPSRSVASRMQRRILPFL